MAQYAFLFVDFYENDGDAFLTPPKVFKTKKLAMEAFNKRVNKILTEEINEEYDEINNRLEKPGYIHLAVNDDTYYTVYIKKSKIIE